MIELVIKIILYIIAGAIFIYLLSWILNYLSYSLFKKRILERRDWDLNICCGMTDGGGINADIVPHARVPRMTIVDIYNLPFKDQQFEHVLCSNTIEHSDEPERFYDELQRVAKHITVVIPPLWDISAVVNLLEHRWIFLSWKKEHSNLPHYIKLPLARLIQNFIGQKISA
jgi:SAM-dependent methyltransferase